MYALSGLKGRESMARFQASVKLAPPPHLEGRGVEQREADPKYNDGNDVRVRHPLRAELL